MRRAFSESRAQNFLDPEHGEQVVEWFHAFEDVEDRAKVVSLDEIKDEGWTLNISRYVLPPSARTSALPKRSLPSKTHSPKHAPLKTTCEPY